jgi:hypothetical protein
MHPTGGTAARRGGVRVFRQFSWLEAASSKAVFSRLAHQWVTRAVGWLRQVRNLVYLYLDELEHAFYNLVKENYHEKNYCA